MPLRSRISGVPYTPAARTTRSARSSRGCPSTLARTPKARPFGISTLSTVASATIVSSRRSAPGRDTRRPCSTEHRPRHSSAPARSQPRRRGHRRHRSTGCRRRLQPQETPAGTAGSPRVRSGAPEDARPIWRTGAALPRRTIPGSPMPRRRSRPAIRRTERSRCGQSILRSPGHVRRPAAGLPRPAPGTQSCVSGSARASSSSSGQPPEP